MIAFLVAKNPDIPTHWFFNLFQALKQIDTVKVLNPRVVKSHELLEYDVVVSQGWHKILNIHPNVLVIDLGYFNRWSLQNPTGTFQVCIGGLNKLPPKDVKPDRAIPFELGARPHKTKPLLVCAQMPNDPQHGLRDLDLINWYQKAFHACDTQRARIKILFRNHPMTPERKRISFAGIQLADQGCLLDYLEEVSGVLCYNSIAGLEAIKRGIPVYCDKSAFYSELAQDLSDLKTFAYNHDRVGEFFRRLGYAQWTDEELGNPQVIRNFIYIMLTGLTPEDWRDTSFDKPPPTKQEFELAIQVLEERSFPKARSMAKQYWRDTVFCNKKDLHNHCNTIVREYKEQKALSMGAKYGTNS